MGTYRVTLVILAGATLASPAAVAQTLPRALDSLHLDRRIRIELAHGLRIEGRLIAVNNSRLQLRVIERPTVHRATIVRREVALDSVVRMWVHDGTHARAGAVIGGLSIGIPFGALFLAIRSDPDGATCDPAETFAGLAVLTGIGAGLGAFLGATFARWRPL